MVLQSSRLQNLNHAGSKTTKAEQPSKGRDALRVNITAHNPQKAVSVLRKHDEVTAGEYIYVYIWACLYDGSMLGQE